MDYQTFLDSKKVAAHDCGFYFDPPDFLFDFQRDTVAQSCERGRSAIFADCGLGKTPMQLVWADAVMRESDKPTLILAPLAVSEQTKREGDKFGIDVNICRHNDDLKPGINITNYEMLHHFKPDGLGGIVLDESSILKNYTGATRKLITDYSKEMRYRLACTATPAPNDLVEIINHSEFLSVLNGKEAIALFFTQDGNTTHSWRLKGHAQEDFWRWLASWSIAMRHPHDLGYADGDFVLPELKHIQHECSGHISDGYLFPILAQGLQEQNQAKRESLDDRVALCADLVNNSTEPWLVWCHLNQESDALAKAIPDAVDVKGSDSMDKKVDRITGFSEGRYRVLVTKPSIAGFGMNWQHCAKMAFVGLSHSFEQMYQATRRCWRFGQKRPVEVHVIVAETEGQVVANIKRKEAESSMMMEQLVSHMGKHYKHNKDDDRYEGNQEVIKPAFL